MESRKEKAVRLFKEGFNCSQAVFAAYSDIYGIDMETALKLSSSFGGGMGRMREVCGAVSGMFLVAGLETGSVQGDDRKKKKENYDTVQQLAKSYKEKNGSIICRELLDLKDSQRNEITTPEERTDAYYKERPCIKLVEDAADILEEILLKDKLKIKKVEKDYEIAQVAALAEQIWKEFFLAIITKEQIEYMLERFQSAEAITDYIRNQGYEYYALQYGEALVGYTGIHKEGEALFLSKLYILKEYRGKGFSSRMFSFLEHYCKEQKIKKVCLTVNKNNKNTIAIYEKKGFQIIREQEADIGGGFVMDDYIMEKKL